MRLLPQSLTGRVFALYAATLAAFLGASVGVFYAYEFTAGIDDAHAAAQNLAEVVAPTVTDSVVIGDYDTVKRTLAKAIHDSPFGSASFIDLSGGRIGARRDLSSRPNAPAWLHDAVAGQLSDINKVITVGGRDYGVLRLRFAPELIAAEIWKVTKVALALALATLSIGLALIRFSLKRWLDPLERIHNVDWRAGEGNLGERGLQNAPTEIREALQAFARAGAALQAQRLTAAVTLEAVTDGVVTTDRDGKILYANPAAARLFQELGGGWVGRDLAQVLPSAFAIQPSLGKLEPWGRRLVEIQASGQAPVYLDTAFTSIPDPAGGNIGQVLTFRDVSASQVYEERLRRELATRESAMRALHDALRGMLPEPDLAHLAASETDLESVSRLVSNLVREREASHRALDNQKFALDQHAAVSIADASGTIVYANEKFCELSGYSIDELVGRSHRHTGSDQHPAHFFAEIWDVISSGGVWHGEIVNRRKNGTLYWVATTIVPWLDAQNRPSQYIAIRTDITAQKTIERALEEARRRELRTGMEIQRSLLIGDLPVDLRGADLASFAEPSQGIDGDFFAFTTYRPDCFELLVGDVMGKGVPAALVGAAIRTMYSRVVTELLAGSYTSGFLPRPAEIVNTLHARLTPRLIELETFATLALYRFDLSEGRVTFVNAGHTPGLMLREGRKVESIHGANLPVGVTLDERYLESAQAVLPGDALVVYSDGITEARADDGQEFGEERLHNALAEIGGKDVPPAICLHTIRKRVRDFVGSRPMPDDQTAVMVAIRPPLPEPRIGGSAGPLEESFELSWDFASLGPLRERIAAAAAAAGLEEEAADGVVLASVEAVTNVVRHVNAPFPGATLCCRLRPAADGLTVEFWYVGLPYEPEPGQMPDLSGSSEGGFGLYIIEKAVSRVAYEHPALDVCCTRLTQRSRKPAIA